MLVDRYIASHIAVELLNASYEIIIADDYSNSYPEYINRIKQITGKKVKAYKVDVKNKEAVSKVFTENKIDCVIHFAGLEIFNIGTGTLYGVLGIINTFEKVNGVKVNYEIGHRGASDLPEVWANVDKATKVLNWCAERDLADMCRDAWNWQSKNPNGYK